MLLRFCRCTFVALILSNFVTGLGNSMGKLFRVTTFGESHGAGVGVTIDGCPPRIPITIEDIQKDLNRRKPGQSKLTTPRQEEDTAEILSGIENGLTTGMPINILVCNKDKKSSDYDEFSTKYRPSHADATYDAKFGIRSVAGGGRASARETIGKPYVTYISLSLRYLSIGRVAAGAIAKKVLNLYSSIEIIAYVLKVQDIQATVDSSRVTESQVIFCYIVMKRIHIKII